MLRRLTALPRQRPETASGGLQHQAGVWPVWPDGRRRQAVMGRFAGGGMLRDIRHRTQQVGHRTDSIFAVLGTFM